jgi:hypothetical protein
LDNATNCKGPPDKAVTTLPAPLDEWGQIVCTPYGPVISAHDGWIWSRPGGYSPVWIPAQMVRDDPAELGGTVYFTKIDFVRVDGTEAETAYAGLHKMFSDPSPPATYRLDVSSVSGRSLRLYFFENGSSRIGIWCTGGSCDPDSWFMVLDMKHPPEPAKQQ